MGLFKDFFVFPFESLYKYRELISYQIRAEFKQKHFQKALGPIWWVGEPLSLAILYLFVTTFLFRNTFEEYHQITIISSVLIWHWFARSVNGSPTLLFNFKSELIRTNLPILPLVYTQLFTQLMIFGFSLIVIFGGMIIFGVKLSVNIIYFPFLIILQFIIITAFVTHIARLGIFFRDLAQIVWVIVGIWFFVSPVIYPRISIPEQFRFWYELNPFAILFPAWRDVLIFGNQPDVNGLLILLAIFTPIAIIGLALLEKNRGEYFKRL